jgi:hypothetical protein
MKKVDFKNFSASEREVYDTLLKSFSLVLCSRDKYNVGLLLHDEGLFFDKMNKTVAEAHLFSIIFNEIEFGKLYNIEVRHGVSLDHLPGQPVMEFHCSEYTRIKTKEDEGEEYKELINKKIPKTYRFAFSFKDELIFTIRKPQSCAYNIEELIQLN